MLETRSIFGKLITLSYRAPEFTDDEPVIIKVRAFVDLLLKEVSERGVDILDSGLQKKFWDLRIELIRFFRGHNDLLHILEDQVLQEISHNYFKKGKHKQLALLLSDCLEVYQAVLASLSKLIGGHWDGDEVSDAMEKIDDTASPEIIKWVNASIALDFYTIIADLVIHNELKIGREQTDLLRQHLRTATENYGVGASIFGLWQPEENDERKLVRNIKIKLAANQILSQENPAHPRSEDAPKTFIPF